MDENIPLVQRMLDNIDAGMPECENLRDHVWFGQFGRGTCAVCLVTTEELIERGGIDG